MLPVSRRSPRHVPRTSGDSSTRWSWCVSATDCLHQSQTTSCGQCRQQSVQSAAQGSNGHGCLVGPKWSVHVGLRLRVDKECHIPLNHKSEIVSPARVAAHVSPSLLYHEEQSLLPTSASLRLQSSHQNVINTSGHAAMHIFRVRDDGRPQPQHHETIRSTRHAHNTTFLKWRIGRWDDRDVRSATRLRTTGKYSTSEKELSTQGSKGADATEQRQRCATLLRTHRRMNEPLCTTFNMLTDNRIHLCSIQM